MSNGRFENPREEESHGKDPEFHAEKAVYATGKDYSPGAMTAAQQIMNRRRDGSDSTVPSDLDSASVNDVDFEKKVFGCPERFLNVLLLGIGFMFSVGALQTCGMAQVRR